MERVIIYPIAVFYFAEKRSFLTFKNLLVNKGTNATTFLVTWRHQSRDHMTRSGWFWYVYH